MTPFTIHTGVAIPLVRDDVDTDRLIPIRFLRKPLAAGYGNFLLADDRFDESGSEVPGFVFNHPRYRGGTIVVSGSNFGCGSAREGAVYAVRDYGIRTVIARGFSDIFRMNCCWNGVLPVTLQEQAIRELWEQLAADPGAQVTVDLERQVVTAPRGNQYAFDMEMSARQRLLEGMDDVGVTLQFRDKIDAFESAYLAEMPWLAPPEALAAGGTA